MSSDWEPKHYTKDETANALLNIAAGLHAVAKSTDELFYAFAYSKTAGGLSISEVLEKTGGEVSVALASMAEALEQK
jgi:hypothetical protein